MIEEIKSSGKKELKLSSLLSRKMMFMKNNKKNREKVGENFCFLR